MSAQARQQRLLETFVALLEDHQKDFDGFVRDIENVRFCRTPLDSQQLKRCEYALRNIGILLLHIQDCIHQGGYKDEQLTTLVNTKNEWLAMKLKVDDYLRAINTIVETTERDLSPLRGSIEGR